MEVIEEKRVTHIDSDEIEIRLGDVVQFIKDNRLKIVVGAVIGIIIGALYAFSKPNVFEVEVTVMPEFQSRTAGSLSSLSAFGGLGIDNANANDAIRPDLYPNVLQSVPFSLNLLTQQVYSKKLNTKTTLRDFINRTSTPGFLDKLLALLPTKNDEDEAKKLTSKNSGQAIQLTKEQYGLVKAVQGSVASVYDKKTVS